MQPSFHDLTTALQRSWSAETSYADSQLPANNPARGQCAVSSLVVQDYFGGDLVRYAVKGDDINENHYCNRLPDGTIIDTTAMQYAEPVTFKAAPIELGRYTSIRERCLDDQETHARYLLLRSRVETYLVSSNARALVNR